MDQKVNISEPTSKNNQGLFSKDLEDVKCQKFLSRWQSICGGAGEPSAEKVKSKYSKTYFSVRDATHDKFCSLITSNTYSTKL